MLKRLSLLALFLVMVLGANAQVRCANGVCAKIYTCQDVKPSFYYNVQGLEVTFIIPIENYSGDMTFFWSFGDGSEDMTDVPSVRYEYIRHNLYPVSVTVKGACRPLYWTQWVPVFETPNPPNLPGTRPVSKN